MTAFDILIDLADEPRRTVYLAGLQGPLFFRAINLAEVINARVLRTAASIVHEVWKRDSRNPQRERAKDSKPPKKLPIFT
jgi:hypothetical protein